MPSASWLDGIMEDTKGPYSVVTRDAAGTCRSGFTRLRPENGVYTSMIKQPAASDRCASPPRSDPVVP